MLPTFIRITPLNNMDNIKVSAVKVSAKIPETDLRIVEKFCEQNVIPTRRFNKDHLVVYDTSYTYTFFKKSQTSFADQHVNITKLQTTDLTAAIEDLAWLIDQEPKYIFSEIDNITATGNIDKQIDLQDFIDNNQDIVDFITYNPERFPGLFVRGKNGKVILFRSGKMVFVGCKTLNQIDNLNKWMLERCVNI